jgi:predicted O-methyltransferase YrrM
MLRDIDNYLESLYSANDEALDAAVRSLDENAMPHISVSPNEGKLLYMLAKINRAQKILEVGALSGYSTIWLARALPEGGKMITLEYEPKHAQVTKANIERAGLAGRVEVRTGAGLDLMQQIIDAGEGPFDVFFIDADKTNYPGYLDLALKLSHVGSVILSDNLIRNGGVLSPDPGDENSTVIAKYNRKLATHPRLETVVLPIVREYVDGLGISLVVA